VEEQKVSIAAINSVLYKPAQTLKSARWPVCRGEPTIAGRWISDGEPDVSALFRPSPPEGPTVTATAPRLKGHPRRARARKTLEKRLIRSFPISIVSSGRRFARVRMSDGVLAGAAIR
jgi:hypothetical protein